MKMKAIIMFMPNISYKSYKMQKFKVSKQFLVHVLIIFINANSFRTVMCIWSKLVCLDFSDNT